MYKSRDKYFTTNKGNLVERIMNSDKFTPYEFMALRYACCHNISKVDFALSTRILPMSCYDLVYMSRNDWKKLKKSYQRCINHLDKCCFKGE